MAIGGFGLIGFACAGFLSEALGASYFEHNCISCAVYGLLY